MSRSSVSRVTPGVRAVAPLFDSAMFQDLMPTLATDALKDLAPVLHSAMFQDLMPTLATDALKDLAPVLHSAMFQDLMPTLATGAVFTEAAALLREATATPDPRVPLIPADMRLAVAIYLAFVFGLLCLALYLRHPRTAGIVFDLATPIGWSVIVGQALYWCFGRGAGE